MLYNVMSSFLPMSAFAYSNIIVVMISFIFVAAVCLFGINYVKSHQNSGNKTPATASSSKK
jgi:large-conductance mechanosensitive channel